MQEQKRSPLFYLLSTPNLNVNISWDYLSQNSKLHGKFQLYAKNLSWMRIRRIFIKQVTWRAGTPVRKILPVQAVIVDETTNL